jgi:hypothetical protein
MKQHTLSGRLLSPAGFGLVLIFCLLPFLTVSCGTSGEMIDSTFTGVDMVVGGEPDITGPGIDAGAEHELRALVTDKLDLEPLALLAALFLFAGMGVSLVRDQRLRHGLATGIAVAAGALFTGAILRAGPRVNTVLSELSEGNDAPGSLAWVIHVRYGFWLVLATLFVLAAGHGVLLARTRKTEPAAELELDPADG